MAGGPPERNAQTILAVLGGRANKAARGAVVLNAAAALYVGGRASDLERGVQLAEQAIDTGAGLAALDRLRVAYAAE